MTEKDKKEIKGYIKKLSEHFEKQVKKLDKNSQSRIDGYIEHVDDRFKVTNEVFVGLNQKLESIEKTLDSHTERIGELLTDMTIVKSDVKELRVDMMEVKSDTKDTKFFAMNTFNNKVDKKHFVDLEGRVRILEKSK